MREHVQTGEHCLTVAEVGEIVGVGRAAAYAIARSIGFRPSGTSLRVRAGRLREWMVASEAEAQEKFIATGATAQSGTH